MKNKLPPPQPPRKRGDKIPVEKGGYLLPYLHLIRWHQPAGTLLLLWPPLWCLVLLSEGWPPLWLVVAFVVGAFLMRSAGCVINDMTDRKLDALVERTRHRPLASGAISMRGALGLLIILLSLSLGVAVVLGERVLMASLLALPLVVAYPWMKRITYWPQLFLGITFNYGVLLASIALTGAIQPAAWWLYAACIFWTLGYDTIYGFQDIADDKKIGIKSTARLFANHKLLALSAMFDASLICLIICGFVAGLMPVFWLVVLAALLCFGCQMWQLIKPEFNDYARLFKSNAYDVGPVILLSIGAAKYWL